MKKIRPIFLSLVLLGVIACTWLVPLTESAMKQVDLGLKRALVSYASARAFSGVLSVIQAAQLDIQPAGVGVTLSPGQILAPINDLVKHFSDFMLLVCVAFGIQKILILLSVHQGVSIALTFIVSSWIILLILRKNVPKWLSKSMVLFLMLRYAIPLTLIGVDALSEHFLMQKYQEAQQAIDNTTTATESSKDVLSPPPDNAAPGWLPKLSNWVPSPSDVKARYIKMKQDIDKSTQYIIDLIVVFLLQAILLPLFLMGGYYWIVRNMFVPPQQPT